MEISVTYSGATILISGGVLIITWLALAFFPVYGLDSVGYCSALTVFACILSNVVVIPSTILAFPNFFSRATFSMSMGCCTACCKTSTRTRTPLLNQPRLPPNKFRACGRLVTRAPYKYVVPVSVLGVFLLGSSQLLGSKLSLALNIDLGVGPEATAYSDALTWFRSASLVPPFTIIANVRNEQQSVVSTSFFKESCTLATKLAAVDGMAVPSLQGIAFEINYRSQTVSCYPVQTAVAFLDPQEKSASAELYRYQFQGLVELPFNRSSLLTFSPNFDPFGPKIIDFVATVRQLVQDANRQSNGTCQFFFYAASATEIDAKDFTFDRLYPVLAVSLTLIFVIVALRFRAAIVPIKLFLTIVLPILFIYGVSVLVFQKGIFDWLGWRTLSSTGADGLSWLLPSSTIFLLVGLALDYEIFLFARVFELRMSGTAQSDEEAIVEAVGKTGSIISAAGVIMALAFSGMLLSSNRFLNQFGFVCIVSILLDTFVVRILVVPALLSIGGWMNWWPLTMPGDQHRRGGSSSVYKALDSS